MRLCGTSVHSSRAARGGGSRFLPNVRYRPLLVPVLKAILSQGDCTLSRAGVPPGGPSCHGDGKCR